jgi:transcriptional regulator with XRE-family HTH domain
MNEKLDRALRTDGRSAAEIAQAAGVSYVALSCIRHGRQTPRLETAARLAAALNRTPAELGLPDLQSVLKGCDK